MEIGQFLSKETQKILPLIIPEEEDKALNQLKEAFRQYRSTGSVKEWNELREEAKEHFSKNEISRLDASGYIHEWIKGK